MKLILLFSFFVISISLKGQTNTVVPGKNRVHYKADKISESAIKNYEDLNGKSETIYDKVLGVDVDIYVDTVFKKYWITYKDKDYKQVVMIYEYLRDYFPKALNSKVKSDKIYLVDCHGSTFMLLDYIDFAPLRVLELRAEDKLKDNCTWVFVVKNPIKLEK